MEEHHKVICAAVEFAKHRVPVVAGTGSNSTADSNPVDPKKQQKQEQTEHLIVTPYYNKATQKGLIGHYSNDCTGNKSFRLLCIMYRDEPDVQPFAGRQLQQLIPHSGEYCWIKRGNR